MKPIRAKLAAVAAVSNFDELGFKHFKMGTEARRGKSQVGNMRTNELTNVVKFPIGKSY